MIHTASGTVAMLTALGRMTAGKKLSRSLAATRYIDFPNDRQDKEWRRRNSQAIKDGAVKPAEKLQSWRSFALDLAGPEKEKSPRLLFARQQSRLLINMAGGVFENGGLSLDRLSGLPVIPGSAIKGCARRLALAALQEWTSDQLQPGDAESPLTPAVEAFIDKEPADLLFEIAFIFGWSDLEWKGREDFSSDKEWQEKRSDFAWASGAQWEAIRRAVVTKLLAHLRITPKKEHATNPWKSLPHFAGTIAFLPAYPWDEDPGIDLDVITCHHGEYYKGNAAYANAPDTEEPVPVVFPAIAPGQTWAFLLHPTARAQDSHLTHARRWLALSLETFGIGAKTNAGYGWFLVVETPESESPNPLSTLLPPPPESEAFLKTWGNKKLNSFSAGGFITQASLIQNDAELLKIFQALAPDQVKQFSPRDPFWNSFLSQPKGKVLLERIKNLIDTP